MTRAGQYLRPSFGCIIEVPCSSPVGSPCEEAGGTPSWMGDGYCDGPNNNEACNWDGGDCSPGEEGAGGEGGEGGEGRDGNMVIYRDMGMGIRGLGY